MFFSRECEHADVSGEKDSKKSRDTRSDGQTEQLSRRRDASEKRRLYRENKGAVGGGCKFHIAKTRGMEGPTYNARACMRAYINVWARV